MKGMDIPEWFVYSIFCVLTLIIIFALMTGKGQLAFNFLYNIHSIITPLVKGAMSSLLFA